MSRQKKLAHAMCLAISHSILSCSALQQGCIANTLPIVSQVLVRAAILAPVYAAVNLPQKRECLCRWLGSGWCRQLEVSNAAPHSGNKLGKLIQLGLRKAGAELVDRPYPYPARRTAAWPRQSRNGHSRASGARGARRTSAVGGICALDLLSIGAACQLRAGLPVL